jgi:hypothetical protein
MDDLIIQKSIPRPKKRKSQATTGVPYAGATTGANARDEVIKILTKLGCQEVGFMDLIADKAVLLQFTHRGRQVQLRASAKGWAQMYLKTKPHTYRMRTSRQDYEQAALRQGLIAVNSILRDWIKGQMTAIECCILSFEAVFMPFMLSHDGRPLIERVADLLPKVEEEKIVALPRQ